MQRVHDLVKRKRIEGSNHQRPVIIRRSYQDDAVVLVKKEGVQEGIGRDMGIGT